MKSLGLQLRGLGRVERLRAQVLKFRGWEVGVCNEGSGVLGFRHWDFTVECLRCWRVGGLLLKRV